MYWITLINIADLNNNNHFSIVKHDLPVSVNYQNFVESLHTGQDDQKWKTTDFHEHF